MTEWECTGTGNAGTIQIGQCTGGTDNRCCVKNGCGAQFGRYGSCEWTSNCKQKGSYWYSYAGMCPGPADFKCCVYDRNRTP